MKGCEIVCPSPIGSGLSAYASARNGTGTNSCRGTAAIASRTRTEETPRLRICVSIIARRSAADASRRGPELLINNTNYQLIKVAGRARLTSPVQRRVRPQVVAQINLPRARDFLLGIEQHFFPLCDPAAGARNREQHGEHGH